MTSLSSIIQIDTSDWNINIPLLKRQKQAILRAIQDAHDADNKKDKDLLDGVLNLLDVIHDAIEPPVPVNWGRKR